MGLLGGKSSKSGYWIQHTHLFRADVYECSLCGSGSKKPLKNCPRCGARMKKSKYDPQWVDEIEIWDVITGD